VETCGEPFFCFLCYQVIQKKVGYFSNFVAFLQYLNFKYVTVPQLIFSFLSDSYPYENGTTVKGGSAIIYTESWAIELNGQHELFESIIDSSITK
jgi:hypothetical protein